MIAGIVLVQLVSKDQPHLINEDDEVHLVSKPESDFIQIGNLIARLPDSWKIVKPSSSMRLMEFRIGNNSEASMAVFKNIVCCSIAYNQSQSIGIF